MTDTKEFRFRRLDVTPMFLCVKSYLNLFNIDVCPSLVFLFCRMTLGAFAKILRGQTPQSIVAKAAGIDHSTISFLESDKQIRFKTMERIFKRGLRVTPQDWNTAKLLWLEQISGEPTTTPDFIKARDTLALNELTSQEEFYQTVRSHLENNQHFIDRNSLRSFILETLANRKSLASLKQFHAVAQALNDN